MNEVEGLTVEAIDWLIEGIEKQGGKSTHYWFEQSDGRGCVLGAIGYRGCECWVDHKSKQRAQEVGLIQDMVLSNAACRVSAKNTTILGRLSNYRQMDKKRGRQMLSWLRAQRALKCSDWAPAPRGGMPERKAVLV